MQGYIRQRTRSNDDFTVQGNNFFISYFHIVNYLVYTMDFSLSRVDKSASEIETNCYFTTVVILLQMPFEKLNYNGDVIV